MPPTASLPEVSEIGVVEARYWENVDGGGVDNLTAIAAFPDNPDVVVELTELSSPVERGDRYGSYVRGFILPPTTGEYRFFIAGDNESQFWLSSDETADTKQMIATVPGSTAPGDFNRYSAQTSGFIPLEAGKRYYFEVLHKERTGGDHFSVAWEGPGIAQEIVGGSAIASLGQSPYETDDEVSVEAVEEAYNLGYRVGYFDGSNNLTFDSGYPPTDMDQDGLYDNWETYHGLDPNNPNDATSDNDDDLLYALDEFWLATSPVQSDTDGDGIPDGAEFANSLNPLDPSDAASDLDGDGASNLEEFNAGTSMNDRNEVPSLVTPDLSYIPGFAAQYFAGRNFDQFVLAKTELDIDNSWGRESPAANVPKDFFSVRWVGTFTAPHSQGVRSYQFQTLSDDGVRLYVDDQRVINKWIYHGPTPYQATVSLDANETVSVAMEYFDGSKGATAKLDIVDTSTGEVLPLVDTVRSPNPGTAGQQDGPDSDADGIPDHWEVAYGLNPWTPDSTNTVNNSGITNLEAYQSGLHPWTLETVIDGSDEPTDPIEPEVTLPVTGEVTLSWAAPTTRINGDELRQADIEGYEVLYGRDPNNLENTHAVTLGETNTTVTGLEAGTWYFSVRTIAGVAGPWSEPLEVTVE